MKNICYLLLLIPFCGFCQDATVFKSNHVKSAVSHLKGSSFSLDSSIYNREGLLIFYRRYNQFKAHDFEDQRHTYNKAGKRTSTVNYAANGQPWLTDTLTYDETGKLIYEKAYRNPGGTVIMEKKITYQGNDIFVNGELQKTKAERLQPVRKEITHYSKNGLISYIDYGDKQIYYRYTTY
jgi:hypothetical protein